MGDTLRDWILPAVRDALGAAATLRAQDKGAPQSQEDAPKVVVPFVRGQHVQLVDFISRKAPYSAWVSDSFTRIWVTFSNKATDAFKKKEHRLFCEGTVGSILGISDFELTIDPTARPSKRVMLRIIQFTLIGSEGSSTFGRPRDVESPEEVEKLLSLLFPFTNPRIQEEQEPESPSSVKSQEGCAPDGTYSTWPLATQASFGTQAAHNFSTQMHLYDQPKSRSELQSTHPPKSLAFGKEALVAILGKNREGGGSSAAKASRSPVDIAGQPDPSYPRNPIDESHVVKDISMPHSKANIQESGKSTSFLSSKEMDGPSNAQMLIELAKPPQQRHSEGLNDTKKENYQKNPENITISTEPKDVVPPSRQIGASLSSQKTELDRNPWEGNTRLPRKYVQISKDQRTLLERADSWYSAGESECESTRHINVPANVIADLRNLHERLSVKSYDRGEQACPITKGCLESSNPVVECSADDSSQASDEHSERIHQDLLRATSEPASDPANEEEIQDDDLDEEVSWYPSSEQDPLSVRSSPCIPSCSPHTRIDRTFNVDSSPNMVYLEKCPRSVSPSSNHAEELDLPQSPEVTSFQAENIIKRRSVMLSTASINRSGKTVSQVLSSSPMEMESAVPYGIDDLFSSSDDIRTAGVPIRIESIPSTEHGTNVNLQVLRTPHMHSHLPKPRSARDEVAHRGGNDDDTRMNIPSSDPVIPSTIDTEGIEYHVPSVDYLSRMVYDNRLSDHMSTPVGVTSGLLSSSVPSHAGPSSPFLNDDKGESADSQLHAEFASFSQRDHRRLPDDSPVKSLRISSYRSNIQMSGTSSMKASLESVSGLDHTLVPATQIFCGSNPAVSGSAKDTSAMPPQTPNPDVSADRLIPSTRNDELPVCSVRFGFSQENSQLVDTSAMVRANRRKFIRQLSNSSQESANDTKQREHQLASPSVDLLGIENENPRQSHSRSSMSSTSPRANKNVSMVSTAGAGSSGFIHNGASLFGHSLKGPITNDELVETGRESSQGFALLDTSKPRSDQDQSNEQVPDDQQEFDFQSEVQHHEHASDIINVGSGEALPTLLEKFRSSYPTYASSERRFIKACTYLQWLRSDKKAAPHPSLWDDFIRAWCDDYLTYISECKPGEKKMSGIIFYNEFVSDPKFTNRIVTPANLHEALLLDPVETERAMKPFRNLQTLGSGRESISAISARSSVGSHDAVTPSYEISQPPQPWHEPNDSNIHPPGTYAAPPVRNTTVFRKPFFETPSQLNARNQPGPVRSPPIASFQNTSNPSEIDITATQSYKRRSLPWSSPPSIAPQTVDLTAEKYDVRTGIERTLVFSTPPSIPDLRRGRERHSTDPKSPGGHRFARMSDGRKYDFNYDTYTESEQIISPKTTLTPAYMETMGSPVASAEVPGKSLAAAEVSTASEGSPILGTRVFPAEDIPQDETFVTPGGSVSKLRLRMITGMSGVSVSTSSKISNTSNNNTSAYPVPAKRKASPLSSTPHRKRPAWDEFVKTYVPRRNRLSSVSRMVSIQSSVTNSPRGEQLHRTRLGLGVEPETQDWN